MFKIKLAIMIIVLTFILFPFLGFAATVGNPSATDVPKAGGLFSLKQDKNISVKTAVDLEFVFDRELRANAAENTKLSSGKWYMTKISYSMFNDRIEPYVKLGLADLKAKWKESGTTEVELETDAGFAWGFGTKALILNLEKPKVKFIGDFLYRVTDLDVDSNGGRLDGGNVAVDSAKSRFIWQEWQVALLAATEIDISGGGREEV
ncbi:MAG: hypothetical protein NC828_03680, partial [Candidatus Omnitrophica bacterium]|nr:hypothetical protein [Candidatus Omnitrophota bacterium]